MADSEGSHDRNETPAERADRNYEEILQELRVAQTGVQILFGFLFALAFYETFPRDMSPNSGILTAAMLCTVMAVLCFTAPVVIHRLYFRQGQKERLVWATHWLALIGMTLFIMGMTLALWLVLARLWSMTTASWVSLGVIPVAGFLWFLWPRWLIGKMPSPGSGTLKDDAQR